MSRTGHLRTFAAALAACLLTAAWAGPAAAQPADKAKAPTEDQLIAVIRAKADWAKVDQACRGLRRIGSARCVPALAELLTHEKYSHMARYALEPMPLAEAGQALRDALGKTEGLVQVGVIASIGYRRDAKATAALAQLLKGKDAAVASGAAAALGRIGTPAAAKALAGFRDTETGPLKLAAAEASLKAAEQLLAADGADAAAAIYRELQGAEWPPHIRLGAFAGSLAAEPDKAAGRVMLAIAGQDVALRGVAIRQVRTLKGTGVAERFAAELPKLSADGQVLLIGALADRGDASAAAAVTAAAGSDSPAVRAAALKALGTIGDAKSAGVLCKALAEAGSGNEALIAATSLRRVKGEGADKAIILAMKAAKGTPKCALIGVLADRKVTGAIGEIVTEAAGGDRKVASSAWKALGHLGQAKDLPALLAALTAKTSDIARSSAERACVQVARKIADKPVRASAALAALKNAATPAAKGSVIRVLGGIATSEAFAAVKAAAGESDADTKDAAVRALADWPDSTALHTLVGVFRTSDNQIHRVLALRGCVRLLGQSDQPAADVLPTYAQLMKLATRADDRKQVLAGLGRMRHAGALAIIESALAEPSVAAEAELAWLQVTRSLVSTSPAAARAAAKKLQAATKSAATRKQAAGLAALVDKTADFVTAWQVSPVYAQGRRTGSQMLRRKLPPESPDGRVEWVPLPLRPASDRPWAMDVGAVHKGANRAAYVRTWLYSPKAQPARIDLATDEGFRLWVGGKMVAQAGKGAPVKPGARKVKATLAKGWNAVLLKVVQNTGPWQFCFQVRTARGEALGGLKVRSTPPAK